MGGGADAGQAALVWAQELWGDLIPPCAKDRPSDSPAADYRLGCVDLATAPPQPPPTPRHLKPVGALCLQDTLPPPPLQSRV